MGLKPMRKITFSTYILIALIMMLSAVMPVPAAGVGDGRGNQQHYILSNGGGHQPVVQQLVDLVNADPVFRAGMEAALLEQEPASFWYGKTLDDMYTFFDEWVVFLPTIDNARLYMDRFYEFADDGMGQWLAARDPLRGWLYQFMLAVAEFNDSTASATAVPWWTSDPRIDMADYIVPPGGYQSFNEFFTREIQPGVRPVDSPAGPAVFTSPADSSIMKIADRLTSVTTIGVKGENLNIRELLGNDPLADNFINGRAILCMLNTTDYHRFHAPVPGTIVSQHQLAGLYYGMDGGWVEYFFQHRRGYLIFNTAKFGHVAMVCVGMFTISSVNFTTSEGDIVDKGDELGNFAYGGSAVILLFEPGRVSFTVPLEGRPVHVNMGQQLATALQPVQTAVVGTGLGSVTFTTNTGSIGGLTAVSPAGVRCAPSGYAFPYGLFSYNISNLRPGQAVRITIRFPNPLPLNTKYFKCNNGVITDCSAFVSRYNEYTLVLDLVDGRQGDADGIANGTIADPGGPGFPASGLSGRGPHSSASVPQLAQAPVQLPRILVQGAGLSPATVAPGETVTVTASVDNGSTVNGTKVIKLYVNGVEESCTGITVNSGNTEQVSFAVQRNQPGTYRVHVDSVPAGAFRVEDKGSMDVVLAGSALLIVFAIVLGLIYALRRQHV